MTGVEMFCKDLEGNVTTPIEFNLGFEDAVLRCQYTSYYGPRRELISCVCMCKNFLKLLKYRTLCKCMYDHARFSFVMNDASKPVADLYKQRNLKRNTFYFSRPYKKYFQNMLSYQSYLLMLPVCIRTQIFFFFCLTRRKEKGKRKIQCLSTSMFFFIAF